MKRVVVVLCAVLISLGWVSGAQAGAAVATKPSAPTSASVVVGKTASEATLTWSAPTSAGSSPVYGYSTVRDGGDTHFVFWDNAKAGTVRYSHSFTNLRPGATYTFVLKAWSNAGSSVGTTVTYTVPKAATSFVYAITGAGSVVRVPVSGGTPTTVFSSTDAAGMVADAAGNIYFVSGGAIRKAPAAGGPVTTLTTGVGGRLDVDTAGNVYGLAGNTVVQVSPAGTQRVVFTSAQPISDFVVTSKGAVTVKYQSDSVEATFVTVQAGGGAPTTRVVNCLAYCFGRLLGDDLGSLYLNVVATGGSGYRWWTRIAAGAVVVDGSTAGPLVRFATGVGPDNRFYQLETTSVCVGPPPHPDNPNQNPCVDDNRVTSVEVMNSDGSSRTPLKVSGFVLPESGAAVAVSAGGGLYVASEVGLVSFASTGGAAVTVASGAYKELAVVG